MLHGAGQLGAGLLDVAVGGRAAQGDPGERKDVLGHRVVTAERGAGIGQEGRRLLQLAPIQSEIGQEHEGVAERLGTQRGAPDPLRGLVGPPPSGRG